MRSRLQHTVLKYQTLADDISDLPLDRRIWCLEGYENIVTNKLACHGVWKLQSSKGHWSSNYQKACYGIGKAKCRKRRKSKQWLPESISFEFSVTCKLSYRLSIVGGSYRSPIMQQSGNKIQVHGVEVLRIEMVNLNIYGIITWCYLFPVNNALW